MNKKIIGIVAVVFIVIITGVFFATRQSKDPTEVNNPTPPQTEVKEPEASNAPNEDSPLEKEPLLPTCTFPPHWGHCAKPPQNRIRYFRGSQTGGLFLLQKKWSSSIMLLLKQGG